MSQDNVTAIPKLGPVIAIDGPAGTGKSSVTRRLADLLGFVHVDTGALYRAVALLVSKQDGSPDSEPERATEVARNVRLEFRRAPRKNPSNRIYANGTDVTDYIRTPEVSMAASRVAAYPLVRSALLSLQRRLGCAGKTILEGRDIGTVIFPDADVKFFLTASMEERAKRRLIELEASGADTTSFEEVKRQMEERDKGDSTRTVAPLKRASDALLVDTTAMTLDEVVHHMELTTRERLSKLKIEI